MTGRLKTGAQVIAFALVAGLLALLVWSVVHQQHAPGVGSLAPAFTLHRLEGPGKVSLASYRGKPVVLNFWASWCEPCKGEAAVLERDWTSDRSRGVVFLGVDYHDLSSDARRFVSAHGLTFPMLEDGSGNVTGALRDLPGAGDVRPQSAGAGGRAPPRADHRSRLRHRVPERDREGRGVMLRFAAVLAAALVFAAPAAACSHPRTSLNYLQGQVMCPTCHTTLDMSQSPAALRIDAFISKKIAACWTAQHIESALVANYGQQILAAPSHKGFDLLAWWLPIAGVLAGALVLAFGVWRWSRRKEPEEPDDPAGSGLDEETERRLDDLLARYD